MAVLRVARILESYARSRVRVAKSGRCRVDRIYEHIADFREYFAYLGKFSTDVHHKVLCSMNERDLNGRSRVLQLNYVSVQAQRPVVGGRSAECFPAVF